MGILEVVVASDAVEVVLLPEIGARIHRIRAFGTDVVRTPDDPALHRADPFFWGGYVMAPWGGRIAAAPTRVGTQTIDLAPNFPDGTAIHGQLYERPWEATGDGAFAIAGGGDGWPWRYEATIAVTVADATVTIDQSVVNRSDEPMPAGIGIHPWFRKPLEVTFRADLVYASNLASEPSPAPVEGDHDLRRMAAMADDLDATWTGLARPPVELRWSEAGVRATMDATHPDLHIVAASPAAIDAVAIEPQTHAPQAIRRLLAGEPGALRWLDPGVSLRLVSRLAFGREDRP